MHIVVLYLVIFIILLVFAIYIGRNSKILSSKIFFVSVLVCLVVFGGLLFYLMNGIIKRHNLSSVPTVKIDNSLQAYKNKQTIVVGTSADLYPWNYKQGTILKGYQIDVLKKAVALMGKKIEFKIMPAEDLYKALQKGEIDVISEIIPVNYSLPDNTNNNNTNQLNEQPTAQQTINNIVASTKDITNNKSKTTLDTQNADDSGLNSAQNTQQKTLYYTYSIKYAEIPVVFFGKQESLHKFTNNNYGIRSLINSLNTQKLVAQSYTPFFTYLKNQFASNNNVYGVITGDDVIKQVEDGKYDVGLIDYYSLYIFLKKHPHSKLRIYKPLLDGYSLKSPLSGGLAFALNSTYPDLKQQFNIALLLLKRRGVLSNLSVEYFNQDINL